jgi:phage-related protein
MWTVETLNGTVDAELEALPDDMLARFARIKDLIQAHGLERLPAPYIDHIRGPLWEIRLKGKDGIARALYVIARARRLVVVRVFVKKTQRTPAREIKLALRRAKEVS